MLTQGIQVQQYIRASAGRAGLSVVFEDTNQPRHDGKTIYLPRITSKTSDNELKQLMSSVDHEVAHDRFSCFDVLKEKKINPKGMLMFVWNFLEDSRVNAIEAREYKGFRDNWDECSSEMIEIILKRAKKEKDSSIAKLTTALICWDSHISSAHFPSIELVTNKTTPNKAITDVLNNYSDRLLDCHGILDKREGTTATYQLAYDILTELGEECKEEFTDIKPASSKKGKGEGEEIGTTKETEDSKEKAKGDAKEDEAEEYKIITVVLTKEDLDKFSTTMPEEGAPMSKIGLNFDPVDIEGGRDWDLTDYEKFIVVNYPKKIGNAKYFENRKKSVFLSDYEIRVGSHLVSQENFAQQVRKLIQIKSRAQTQYGVKKGKLDQSRLSRICFNAPGFNERVFKNKIENKILDAAITVLVDMSGSMGGGKAFYALASTLLLNEVCSTLNIPLEIIGFTDDAERYAEYVPAMFVYKSFSDLKVSSDDLKDYFATSSSHMCGNPDGENIIWAHDRLIKRKEKKKMLVVMSDGSPAASKSSCGLERFTLKVIREIEKTKKVDIYGLGLCSPSVQEYYKSNSVIDIPEEIPSKLLSLIERKILNV